MKNIDQQSTEGWIKILKPIERLRKLFKISELIILFIFLAVLSLILIGCQDNQNKTKAQEASNSKSVQGSQNQTSEETAFPKDTVLATVNGDEILLNDLNKELSTLSKSQQNAYAKSQHEFLESMISRQVLLQEAKQIEIGNTTQQQAGNEQELLSALIREKALSGISVQEDDLRSYYEQNKSQMPDKSFEELKEQLWPFVWQLKKRQALDGYINALRQNASISKNYDWIEAQKVLSADNPLSKALKTGRPVVADFGRGACVPCKMMEPILKELQKEYQGRAEVLILDVQEYSALTKKHSVRSIPTQIFFDASGQEIKRHVGFMSKEAIVEVLKDLLGNMS